MNSPVKIISAIFIACGLIFASLFFGAEKIAFVDFIQFSNYDNFTSLLIWHLRFPRTITVMLTGALLAGSGCVFQGFFRNALADSSLMGVSSGATLGTLISIILGIPFYYAFSFLGAIFAVCAAYFVGVVTSRFSKHRFLSESTTLLLCGIALSSLFSAITALLIIKNNNSLHKIYLWTLGSFAAIDSASLKILIPFFVISMVLFYFVRYPLDILAFGEESALSLGLNIKFYRPLIIIAGAFATAGAVCIAGTIGFVGLISPHIARRLFSVSHNQLIWTSMYIGSVLLLFSDIFAKTLLAPAELPIGIITALLGVPFFFGVLIKGEK
ncbi:MAG: FecCD family ABC transporter permease [Treponemataceae bacterium]